jgi:hypothetical protein
VFACVVALGMSTAMAQEPIRLQIEVTRDGSLVATPELRLPSGREGRLELSGEWARHPLLKGLREKITITPTVRGDDVALAFNIASGDKQFRPALVITGVMDLRPMAVVAAAISVERLAPAGERIARAIGAVVVGAALFLIGRAAGLG